MRYPGSPGLASAFSFPLPVYPFADSAHSPMFEEPEAFLLVMTEDVLRGRANLADKD